MQLLADNNLTQHVRETTRQNNILDLVISTEEELIANLKITDKIGDMKQLKVVKEEYQNRQILKNPSMGKEQCRNRQNLT